MISLNRLKLRFTLDSLPIIIIIIIIHCFDWREYFLVTPKDSLMLDHDNNIHEYDISHITSIKDDLSVYNIRKVYFTSLLRFAKPNRDDVIAICRSRVSTLKEKRVDTRCNPPRVD